VARRVDRLRLVELLLELGLVGRELGAVRLELLDEDDAAARVVLRLGGRPDRGVVACRTLVDIR